jgi:anthranilate synthase component 1
VIQEFSGQFKSEKTTLNLSIMVCLDIFSYDAVRYFEKVTIAKRQ